MIKAVLFDYGGVLSEGGKAGAIRQIFAKAYTMDPESLRFEDVGLEALKGTISDEAFLATMNQRHPNGSPVTIRQFLTTVDALTPCVPVYELAESLRKRDIATGVLSNTLCLAADTLRARGAYDRFEPVLLSCEEHLAKPDTALYQRALQRLGLDPNQVIFIDDQPAFLEPATALGMHTILAVSPGQIVADTEQIIKQESGQS